MLKALTIKNIAVIESVSIDFAKGFNILTGETGAGKSIIIDSLGLLRGERAQKNIIRTGENTARVDAVFDISPNTAEVLGELLGMELYDEILITREISSDGRSTARINGCPAVLSMLKTVGEMLFDIHGQHDNTGLLSPRTHMGFLDKFGEGEIAPLLGEYQTLHREYTEIKDRLEEIDTDEKELERKTELLKYQIEEIDMSGIYIGEDDELCERKTVLENAYKIANGTSKAYRALYEGDDMSQSAYDALWSAISAIENLSSYHKELETACEALNNASDIISENARLLKNICDDVEETGGELDEVESRLEDIGTLKIKYGNSIEEILSKRDKMAEELESISSGSMRIKELTERLLILDKEREKSASKLTEARKKWAEKLSEEVTASLRELCMPKVQFGVSFEDAPYKSDGADRAEFLICTNAGEAMRPLSRIASGGELSRIMLAIKGVLADCDKDKLLIFDEVDTGVSGAAAQSIGEKLWNTSRFSQVICITHLPQIAAMADVHHLISKEEEGGRTRTNVKMLSLDERAEEIARTLGGASVTQTALKNAQELIALAQERKFSYEHKER